jgi:hypothetical protein
MSNVQLKWLIILRRLQTARVWHQLSAAGGLQLSGLHVASRSGALEEFSGIRSPLCVGAIFVRPLKWISIPQASLHLRQPHIRLWLSSYMHHGIPVLRHPYFGVDASFLAALA